MAALVPIGEIDESQLSHSETDSRILYKGQIPLFVLNPMLCVGVPVQDAVSGVAFTTLQVTCDSTSSIKTEQNRRFLQIIDLLLRDQKDLPQTYVPIVRDDGTIRLKVLHREDVKIVDRHKAVATLDIIVPNATFCKFTIEPRKQIIRESTRALGIWVHHVLMKPVDASSNMGNDGLSKGKKKSKGKHSDKSSSFSTASSVTGTEDSGSEEEGSDDDSDEEGSDEDSDDEEGSETSGSVASSASSRSGKSSKGSSKGSKYSRSSSGHSSRVTSSGYNAGTSNSDSHISVRPGTSHKPRARG